MKTALLITAGGHSRRFGRNKLIEKVKGKEIILHTLDAFNDYTFEKIVITVSEELKQLLEQILKDSKYKNIKLVLGGKTRQESVYNGLKELKSVLADKSNEPNLVIIHDGARPLIDKETIDNCIEKAVKTGAAISAVPVTDTIKIVETKEESAANKNIEGLIVKTPDRAQLWAVQTPQIFEFDKIFTAHEKLKGESYTDDAGMLEALNDRVYISQGSYKNIKITHENDISIMNEYLS